MGRNDVEAPKEETVMSTGRLDPKKSYQNFRWMFQMYSKPSITHEMVSLFCGASVSTVRRWFKKLDIKMFLDETRETDRYKNWRKRVFKRDGWRCTQCSTRVRLHAHHIKPWAKYPKLRYVVSNGKVLCDKCHKGRHPWMTLLYDSRSTKRHR